MARQRSILNLKGTLGELTFYERKGKSYVRRRGTLTKDRIMKDPQFIRTRENMKEFTGAANVANRLRFSFSSLNEQLGGTTVHARLTGLFRRISNKGEGKRGRRSIDVLANKDYLKRFEFNEEKAFTYVFTAFYDPPTIDENRNEVRWTVPPFNLETELKFPVGCTHYQFVLATAVLCDHEFDVEQDRYVPVDDSLMQLRSVVETELLEAETPVTTAIPMVTNLGLAEPLPETAISITVTGVLFYQESNGELYPLKSEQALRITNVS